MGKAHARLLQLKTEIGRARVTQSLEEKLLGYISFLIYRFQYSHFVLMDLALHNLFLYRRTDKEQQIGVKMAGWVR